MVSNYRNNEDSVARSFTGLNHSAPSVHAPHSPASGSSRSASPQPGPSTSGHGQTAPASTAPAQPANPAGNAPVSLNHPGLNTSVPRPNTVWRADGRDPYTGGIFENGFSSVGLNHPQGPNYSLPDQVHGGAQNNRPGYVSTTGTSSVPYQFLPPRVSPGSGPPPVISHNGTTYIHRNGWVYSMTPTGNMVHVPSQSPNMGLQHFTSQDEWAAVGRIDHQNVQQANQFSGYVGVHPQTGQVQFLPPQQESQLPPELRRHEYPVPNPNYDPNHQGYDPNADPASGFGPNVNVDRPSRTQGQGGNP